MTATARAALDPSTGRAGVLICVAAVFAAILFAKFDVAAAAFVNAAFLGMIDFHEYLLVAHANTR